MLNPAAGIDKRTHYRNGSHDCRIQQNQRRCDQQGSHVAQPVSNPHRRNSSMFALLRFGRSNVMGVWGTSLYSGDFAMDLRGTIGAVLRLPFDVGKLVDILCEHELTAAMNPDDEDHTTFWLVLADQFVKRGIDSERARSTALAIIDADEDIAALEKLGMKPADIRKRRKMLYEVRARILDKPSAPKPRSTLKNPQPLVM